MPLRYSKVLRRIFKDILHMQKIAQLEPDTDDKLREYLHTHRKALRELQWIEDKLLLARAVPEAHPSVVDLLTNNYQLSEGWLQQPGQHSFNDEMNGISPEDREKMDTNLGNGVK